jgi:hypothetical protein
MRSLLAASVGLLALLALAAPSSAVLIDQTKWSSLPDMSAYGYDFSSEVVVPSTVADDFLCTSPLPVVELRWWGSYYDPGMLHPYDNSDNLPDPTLGSGQTPGILQGFMIEFYTDVPTSVDPSMPWSHPGDLLYQEFIPIASVAETLYGTVTHIGAVQENVWEYQCQLPILFPQDPDRAPQDIDGDGILDGTVYWLAIQAVHEDEQIQWGWHEADSLWHDNAVQHWGPDTPPPYWDLLPNKDMAFEVTCIPEPAVAILASIGLLAVFRRRRS